MISIWLAVAFAISLASCDPTSVVHDGNLHLTPGIRTSSLPIPEEAPMSPPSQTDLLLAHVSTDFVKSIESSPLSPAEAARQSRKKWESAAVKIKQGVRPRARSNNFAATALSLSHQFETMHVYQHRGDSGINSFQDLTTLDQGIRHLIRLDLSAPNSDVLPLNYPKVDTWDKYTRHFKSSSGRKNLTIIDTRKEDLLKDVNNVLNHRNATERNNIVVTKNKYNLTLLKYSIDNGALVVTATRQFANVALSFNEDGEIINVVFAGEGDVTDGPKVIAKLVEADMGEPNGANASGYASFRANFFVNRKFKTKHVLNEAVLTKLVKKFKFYRTESSELFARKHLYCATGKGVCEISSFENFQDKSVLIRYLLHMDLSFPEEEYLTPDMPLEEMEPDSESSYGVFLIDARIEDLTEDALACNDVVSEKDEAINLWTCKTYNTTILNINQNVSSNETHKIHTHVVGEQLHSKLQLTVNRFTRTITNLVLVPKDAYHPTDLANLLEIPETDLEIIQTAKLQKMNGQTNASVSDMVSSILTRLSPYPGSCEVRQSSAESKCFYSFDKTLDSSYQGLDLALNSINRPMPEIRVSTSPDQKPHILRNNLGGIRAKNSVSDTSVGDIRDALNRQRLGGYVGMIQIATNDSLGYYEMVYNIREAQSSFNSSIKFSYSLVTKRFVRGGLGNHTRKLGFSDFAEFFHTSKDVYDGLMADDPIYGSISIGAALIPGPLGDIADMGLGAYDVVNSIKDLVNANNKYDRVEAILNIVEGAIDLAISGISMAVSSIFPPLAPILDIVGPFFSAALSFVVGLVTAANAVAKANSVIPMSSKEKKMYYNSHAFNFFSKRKDNYIDDLIKEKGMNNAIVEHNLRFLQNNPDIEGIIFPALQINQEGACTYKYRSCKTHFIGCLSWNSWRTGATGCNLNQYCKGYYCKNQSDSRNQHQCNCGSLPPPTFGTPRGNNYVDFRSKAYRYLERAVPSDVSGGNFLCKPNQDQSSFVTASTKTYTYRCDGAIGLIQSYSRSNRTLLFALEHGQDTAYASYENKANAFFVKTGQKNYNGGSGRDEFVLDSCNGLTGTLNGGSGDDWLTVSSGCNPGGNFEINTVSNTVRAGSQLQLQLSSIEHIRGRPNAKESAVIGCGTKSVDLQAGSSTSNRDSILLDSSCTYEIAVFLRKNTNFISKARYGKVNIVFDDSNEGAYSLYLPPAPTTLLQVNALLPFQSKFASVSIQQADYSTSPQRPKSVNLRITNTQTSKTYIIDLAPLSSAYFTANSTDLIFQFNEAVEMPAILSFSLNPVDHVFYHRLKTSHYSTAVTYAGPKASKNIFDLDVGTFYVTGGDLTDEFNLFSTNTKGTLDGGAGDNLLRICNNITTSKFTLDLSTGLTNAGQLTVRNVKNIIGRDDMADEILTGCETVFVQGNGGSASAPDRISTPFSCAATALVAAVSGRTTVDINHPIQAPSFARIFMSPSAPNRIKLDANLNIMARNGVAVYIQSTDLNWAAMQYSVAGNIFSTSIKSPSDGLITLRLDFQYQAAALTEAYLPFPTILFARTDNQIPSRLIIERANGKPKILHTLAVATATSGIFKRYGFNHMENIFNIVNGTWQAYGGNSNDMFAVKSEQLNNLRIDGLGGDNVIVFDFAASELLQINTAANTVFLTGRSGSMYLNRVQTVVGREKLPDTITVSCSQVKSVNGRGGRDRIGKDTIIVPDSTCTYNLKVLVSPNTDVLNRATRGNFTYFIEDVATMEMDLKAHTTNFHFLQFKQMPWEIIDKIEVNAGSSPSLSMVLKSGGRRTFPLGNIQDDEYQNPKFQFANEGWTCDLHIVSDGTTYSVCKVYSFSKHGQIITGMPVSLNHFAVSIPYSSYQGSIVGPAWTTDNLFWINDLGTPLTSLDGGGTNDSFNSLHFSKDFAKGESITVDLVQGFVDVTNKSVKPPVTVRAISSVANIHSVVGRDSGMDTVYPNCRSTSVQEFEHVVIKPSADCSDDYSLLMGIRPGSKVSFLSAPQLSISGAFHYRFLEPGSIDIEGYELYHLNHFFYLPMSLDKLQTIKFTKSDRVLSYSLPKSNTSNQLLEVKHKMLAELSFLDTHYTQPQMMTADGFQIHVLRGGSIQLTTAADAESPLATASVVELKERYIPMYAKIASKLNVTIMVQASEEHFVHIGHGNEKDRNVLQSVIDKTSHLHGGGASNTIYDVIDLQQDVYIYPGPVAARAGSGSLGGNQFVTSGRQTIDLSGIVTQIRQETGTKYVPEVTEDCDDLLIRMTGHEDKYPATLVIVGGSKLGSSLQVLLQSTVMTLHSSRSNENSAYVSWKLQPEAVEITPGQVFVVSPDDLEDGQEVRIEGEGRVQNNEVESYFLGQHGAGAPIRPFGIAREGNDLYFTDLDSVKSGDPFSGATTIVLPGFYSKPETQKSLSANGTDPFKTRFVRLPVENVRVKLPGIDVTLEAADLKGSSRRMEVRSWKSIVEDVENLFASSPIKHATSETEESADWLDNSIDVTKGGARK